jgi:D-alanyl-D-alanine carboxypeptidase/D-alanyl-D-alanine-endopeptidase (penicillin-binding protein 4)
MLFRATKSLLAKADHLFRPLRLLGLAGLMLPIALPLPASASSLPPRVEQALKAGKLNSDALSLAVIPLTGPGSASYFNADVAVNPASTMKLVTPYAALELLGPTYKWKTAFYTDGPLRNGVLQGNLYLKGGGDPKLTMERLWLLLRRVRHAGVQHIEGALVLERNHFRNPAHTPFDDDGGDRSKPYLVEPDALMVNLKTLRLIVRGEARGAAVQAEPPIPYIQIDNRVRVTAPASCPGWPQVTYNFQPQANGTLNVVAAGEIPEGCSGQRYLALLDHPAFTGGTVRALWSELGGSISGQDRLGSTPGNARLLAQAWSPDVVEVIRDINKYSNNTMARQLFLSIGARHRLPSDADDAAAALSEQWAADPGRLVTLTGRLISDEGPVPPPAEDPWELTRMSPAALLSRWHDIEGLDVYRPYLTADEPMGGLVDISSPAPDAGSPVNWLNLFYAAEWVVFAGFSFYFWYRL